MDTIWQITFPGAVIFCASMKELMDCLHYAGPILDYIVELVFLDYDHDATICQDDYEYWSRSGQYANLPF